MKYIFIGLIVAFLVFGIKAYKNSIYGDSEFGTGKLSIMKQNGEKIFLKVKVADNHASRVKGLMMVESMPEDEAMLFIFEKEEMRKMWMENTIIPLDMLFISREKTIFNFHENAVPYSRQIIYSAGPALFVVELNAGFIKKHNITKGDKIEFSIK